MTMNWKKTIIIFVSLLGLALILFFYGINFQRGKNTISVEVENIDINKVTIELYCFQNKIVFENGKQIGNFNSRKGFVSFDVFYDGLHIASANIFQSGDRSTHDFFFYLAKNNSTFDFSFRVEGFNSESLHYIIFTADELNRTKIGVHHSRNGKTGFISVEYFDDNGNVIVDEGWRDGTLVNLNLYINGNWYRNFNINNRRIRGRTFKLFKESHDDLLKYIHQTFEDGEKIKTDTIIIKNCRSRFFIR